jgi:hypothetical protein
MSLNTPQRDRTNGMLPTAGTNPKPFLHHHYDGWVIAIIAMAIFLPTIIVLGAMFGMQRSVSGLYVVQDIVAGIAWLAGLVGMYIYVARVRGWSLPHALTFHWDGRETNVRLLTFSLIALILPVVLVVMHHVIHR